MDTTDVATTGPPDDALFRRAMSRFATGVTVVTAIDDEGDVTGMTANAVASVSLEPLLVLVCVERTTDVAERVVSGKRFALNVLAADQEELARRFADPARARGWQVFDDLAVATAVTGCPILTDGLAWLDCVVTDIHVAGDHLIVVGEVVVVGMGELADSLGYFDHDYVTIPTGRH